MKTRTTFQILIFSVLALTLAACAPVVTEIQSPSSSDSKGYVIGPEDVLHVYVWKEDHLTRTVPVRADGKISLPLVEEIQAAGLTPLELQEAVTQKLKDFIDSPNVTVVVQESNSYKVTVSGQVKSPGIHKLKSETTLIEIISMSGGVTDWARTKRVMIVRKEGGKETRFTVNYNQALKGTDPAANIVLKPGDIVIVP
jgi:polysaccharide biosynthesis/export protein